MMVDISNWKTFTREDFEILLEYGYLFEVKLDDEQKLLVHWRIRPYIYGDWICTSDMPSYHALLEITGPLKPNCPRSLWKSESNEEISPPDSLEEEIFMCGFFNKFDVLDRETIELWSSRIREDRPREHYKFRGAAYVVMLEKHFGPLKPGDVIELPYLMPVGMLEESLDSGKFSKIEVLEDGSVKLWCSEVKDGKPRQHFNYPAYALHIKMIEKHLGPLKPGDIFELPEDMQ